MTEIDEGTKFAVQIMSAMHNGTTDALEGVIRDFCIESRTRQALLWLIRDKIIELANEDVLVHPKKYTPGPAATPGGRGRLAGGPLRR